MWSVYYFFIACTAGPGEGRGGGGLEVRRHMPISSENEQRTRIVTYVQLPKYYRHQTHVTTVCNRFPTLTQNSAISDFGRGEVQLFFFVDT